VRSRRGGCLNRDFSRTTLLCAAALGLGLGSLIFRKVGDSGVLLSPVESANLAHNPKAAGSVPPAIRTGLNNL
jgi:hypothetical protein